MPSSYFSRPPCPCKDFLPVLSMLLGICDFHLYYQSPALAAVTEEFSGQDVLGEDFAVYPYRYGHKRLYILPHPHLCLDERAAAKVAENPG